MGEILRLCGTRKPAVLKKSRQHRSISMCALALRILLVAHVVVHSPGVKLIRTTQRRDASLGELLRTLQSSRNDTTFWTKERNETSSIPAKELAVHLSTVPNSVRRGRNFSL